MRGRKHFHFHPPVVLITHSAAIARIRIQSDKSGTTGRSIRHNIPRCLSSLNGADSPPAHLIGDRMHDCQQGERGSLTRRQLGEKSAIEVVGKSYHHPRRRKDGTLRLVLITFGLLSSGEGRETFLLPFSYRVMKSLLRGRRRRHRRSRSVGRRRKTGQSIGIDRLRELSEGEGEWMDWPGS